MKNLKFVWALLLPVALFVVGIFPTNVSAMTISSLVINVTEPIHGQKPNYNATSPTSGVYNVGVVAWYRCASISPPSGCVMMATTETFVAGQYYLVNVGAFASAGNDFDISIPVTINGQIAESANDMAGVEAGRAFLAKHSYGFNITPSGNYTFPAKTVGYSAVDEYTFVVQSTSTETIKISMTISGSASAFDVKTTLPGSPTQEVGLGVGGGKVTFKVSPKTGLAAGTYNAKITIYSPSDAPTKAINVSFVVKSTDSPGGSGPGSTDPDDAEPGSDDDDSNPTKDPDSSNESGKTNNETREITPDADERTPICCGNESKFNWLWILFGGLTLTAIGTGVAFFIVRKKETKIPTL